MSSNIVANVFVSGNVTTFGNIQSSNVFQFSGPETLTASGPMNPYRPSVLRPVPQTTTMNFSLGMVLNGGTCAGNITNIITDPGGNVYVTGYYSGLSTNTIKNMNASVNGSTSGSNFPSRASGSIFYLKYNSSGTYQYGSMIYDVANGTPSIALDSNRNIYLAFNQGGGGQIYASGTTPGNTTIYSSNTSRGFGLIKYNSGGAYQYSVFIDCNADTPLSYPSVACDSSDNVYLVGTYLTTSPTLYNMTQNPGTSSSGYTLPAGGPNGSTAIIKYNSSGAYVSSSVLLGNNPPSYSYSSVVCDSSGNVYVTGSTSQSGVTIYNLTASPNSSSSGYNISVSGQSSYIIIYSSNGTYLRSMSLYNSGRINNIAIDTSNNVYITGQYTNSTPTIYNITTSPNSSATAYSLPSCPSSNTFPYMVKYDSSGSYVYATALSGSGNNNYGTSVAVSSNGYVSWGGYSAYTRTIYNLTANPNTSSSGYNLANTSASEGAFFIIYNSSTGTYQSSSQLIGAYSYCYGTACNSAGTVFFGGQTGVNSQTIYNLTTNPNTSSFGTVSLGAANYQPFIFSWSPFNPTSIAMTLPNLGTGVTNVITKPIYVKSGFGTTITENSNVFTVPASANVATATWTTDRWVVTYQ